MVEGLVVWALVIPLALFGVRNSPGDLGQQPDGRRSSLGPVAAPPRGRTLAQASRVPLFWVVITAVGISGMLSTAVAFHQIDLLGERGLSSTEAAANFLPQTAAALLATLAVGALIDRVDPRWVTAVCMGLLAGGLLMGTVVAPGWSAIAFGALIGGSGGAVRTVEAGAFPRYFGTTHLGSIRGVVAAVSVGSTALGPVGFALVHDATGGYGVALVASAALPLVVGVVALLSPVPPPLAEAAVVPADARPAEPGTVPATPPE
ncbi:hypothetical protein A7K94_0204410 [Modestobacter sp. VKM Ac-2676]|nr:hypothetical protein A7K94_0204410 [Modestobacter sp. VKM Ac-2676]